MQLFVNTYCNSQRVWLIPARSKNRLNFLDVPSSIESVQEVSLILLHNTVQNTQWARHFGISRVGEQWHTAYGCDGCDSESEFLLPCWFVYFWYGEDSGCSVVCSCSPLRKESYFGKAPRHKPRRS